jgi:hypothetical protein
MICNLLGDGYPGGRAQLFGRVLFLVLGGMYAANEDMGGGIPSPSDD